MSDGAASKRSGMAIASLVLGLLSCLCIPAPIGLVLGIIALVQIGKDPNLRGRGLAIAGVATSAVFGVMALLAAIALPSFLTFGARSKQWECKTNLKGLYTTAHFTFGDTEKYTADFTGLDWRPEAGRRYAYVTAALPISAEVERTVLLPDKPDSGPLTLEHVQAVLAATQLAGGVRPGVEGSCPDDCSFTAMCVGNLDSDATLDIWSISTKRRVAADGTRIDPGMPFLEKDDTKE